MKPELRPAIHMEKQLGWTNKLGGKESLGISKAGQTVLARLMESQIWHQLAGFVCGGGGTGNGQCLLLTPMPATSAFPNMPLVPFKLPPWHWSSEEVSLSR